MNGEHNSFHRGLQAVSGHAGHQWRVKGCHSPSASYHSEKRNHPRRPTSGPSGKVASLRLLAGEFIIHGDAPPLDGGEGSGFRSSPRLHPTPDASQLDCGEGSDERLVWKDLPPSGGPAAGPRGASLRQLFQRPALNLQEHRRLIDEKAHISARSWRTLSFPTLSIRASENESSGQRGFGDIGGRCRIASPSRCTSEVHRINRAAVFR